MGPQARQMLNSPEFRRIITDPEAMRQASRMSRMFGLGPRGGAGAQNAFPAPGATDTTPADEPGGNPAANTQAPAPDFASMFGAPGTNPQAGSPFAALFNPGAFGQAPLEAPPVPGSAGQSTPATGGEASRDGQNAGQPNPFANPMMGMFGNNSANPMMQNPMMQNMAQNLMRNPELMEQLTSAMFNPGGATNPSSEGNNTQQNNPWAAMLGGAGGAGEAGANPFAGLGGFGMPPAAAAAPADTRPPEVRYEEQLRQLNEMGFFDFERNVEALRRSGGNVQGAVEYLFS